MNAALDNLHIVVTRPLKQAGQARDKLQAAGASVSLFPLLEIAPVASANTVRQQLSNTHHYDCVIFISTNAVEYACALGGDEFLSNLHACRIGAIGKRTAEALNSKYIPVHLLAESGFTSEDFLALSALETVNKQNFLIIRGEGGRELLAETLRQRGAQVDYTDVYRRICPDDSTAEKLALQYQQQQIDIIALTSSESLHNLLALTSNTKINNTKWLKQTALLVGSQRIAEDARQAGFMADIIVASDPGDHSMQTALIRWRQDSIK